MIEEEFTLFLNSLDSDRNIAGEKYEMLRRKLIKFFQWQRSSSAEDLADKVMDRVARRLFKGEVIRDISKYVMGVARLVALEDLKEREKELRVPASPSFLTSTIQEADIYNERKIAIVQVLNTISKEDRTLLLDYFTPDIDRKDLAKEMQISATALRLRVFRLKMLLRERIESSMKKASYRGSGFDERG
jgi:DNA-directed RNA polymerase specialized sigma24 family protein